MRRFITMMVWAMVFFTIGFSSSTAWGWTQPNKMYLYGWINEKNSWVESDNSNRIEMEKVGSNTWRAEITWTGSAYFRIMTESNYEQNYAYPESTQNLELNASSKNIPTNNGGRGGSSDVQFFVNNLKGKYIYVRWADNNDGCFTVSIVDKSILPDNIWIFGNVGDVNNWSNYETAYQLSKTGTENGKSVYTGKLKFRNGENWFRFWDGCLESGPSNTSGDDPISINTSFNTTPNTARAFYIKTNAEMEYDVKLVYNDIQSYSVTIEEKAVQTPANLYVYSTENYGTPAVTLTKDATSGKYTATLDAAGITKAFSGKRTYYLFLSDENIAGTEWKNFNGHLYTPDGDQTVKNGEAISMAKEDNGAFVWTLKHDLTNLSFEADLSSNTFTMSTTIDEAASVFIFGQLGYTSDWSNDRTSQCVLTETGTKTIGNVDYPLYTGKIKLREGLNKFRVYDNVELGPQKKDGVVQNKDYAENIELDKMFYVQVYNTTETPDWHFAYTSPKAMERDVELVYYGPNDVGITIKSAAVAENLYLYDETNLANPLGTFKYEYDGVYSLTYNNPQNELKLNTTHKLFITDKEVANATSMQSFKNRWTTTNKGGITLTNNNAFTAISKNTTGGVMNWTLTDKNATAVKMTADMQKGTFTITTTTSTAEYYLCGDINGWEVEKDNVASPNLNAYRFVPVQNADVNNETGWYVLYVPRMHGQFKIHTGGWGNGNESWGCTWTNNNTYADISNKDLPTYLEKSVVPESMPTAENLGHEGTSEDLSFYNMRCTHNYYNNAYIYFNPTAKKLFIKGTSEDIFVYYYNGDDATEKAGDATINIKENEVNVNTNHYYYDKSHLSSAMESKLVTEEERTKYPALKNVPEGDKCYKAQVPAGLEEKYRADGKDHYFQFYLDGASKVGKNDMDVFSGHNVYYIYTGTLPAVLFNYKDADGNEVFAPDAGDNVIEICYRLIAIDADGVPQYLKKDGDVTTMTTKRSEATKYILDQKLENGTAGFAPASGTIWHGVKPAVAVQSVMAKAAEWTTQVEPVKAGDVNRYVEFDVKLQDPEGNAGDVYHEFTSDFVLSADNDKDAWVQDGQIDQKAQMTGALLPGRDTNPQYKLNGTDLYAMAQTSVPTGIKEIENNEYDEEGEAETVYYNLQGVRVANPDRGIYIMVKGKTSKKVRF